VLKHRTLKIKTQRTYVNVSVPTHECRYQDRIRSDPKCLLCWDCRRVRCETSTAPRSLRGGSWFSGCLISGISLKRQRDTQLLLKRSLVRSVTVADPAC